jgi:cell division protein ZipA
MDRDTVRLLLIIASAIVLAGIYAWGRYRQPIQNTLFSRRKREAIPSRDFEDNESEAASDDFEEGVRVITPWTDTRREPQMSGLDFNAHEETDDFELEIIPESHEAAAASEISAPGETSSEGGGGAPFLIQVSVVAGPGRFFHGAELKQALMDVDLLFGDMGIFHRYDLDLTQTLFSVASLVEPGTFPIDDMNDFECPGIVLFFQTARVSDPLGTYDDLVNTSRELAQRLHGIQWDESRQPLSASKIAHMRNLLKQPSES